MADVEFNLYQGSNLSRFPKLYVEIHGSASGADYIMEDYPFSLRVAIRGYAYAPTGFNLNDDPFQMRVEVRGSGITNVDRTNWVAWSQIGSANFEHNYSLDAGYRPMSWPGYVYQIRQLGNSAVVYGSSGVTMMYPVSQPLATFGFKDLLKIGLMGMGSVAGDESTHFFITSDGTLWMLGENGLKQLGYKRVLSTLSSPVMMWDKYRQRLYISDEKKGYIFNDGSLGGWIPNVTGILEVDNGLSVFSPSYLIVPSVELRTTVLDFNYRGRKSLEGVELGIESDVPVKVAYEYRYDKGRDFRLTNWVRTSPDGYCRLRVTATEFRIRVRTDANAPFKLHYLNMFVKFPDKRFSRGYRGVQHG